ncbi:hypothetical protein HUN59_14770 [Curtobacterium sp. Csp2]|uniref:hypothetical protein n=1 Tax=Curtobacterium sp. Csp2 TaxID=2495430 RepID=UPI001580E175|nr:hypothetical protein [Curtobacterium sp. Csp2]QKS17303.1 hypothetical protein HUN59_14770 [Curtobacterium sp. Csp2]
MSDDDAPISGGYMSWDDERRARFDEARERAAKAIADMCRIHTEDDHTDDPPYVQGWVAVAEWTNVEFERNNAGGRYIFSPYGQMLSVGAGLADWARSRHL